MKNMSPEAADLSPESDWVDFRTPFDDLVPSFVRDEPGGQALRAHYYKTQNDSKLVGKAWFGPLAKGPPGHAHGGSQAALLDDAMGTAAWLAGFSVVAAQITIQFRSMLPLQKNVRVEAWVERVEGRKVFTRGKVFFGSDEVYSEGEGLFIALTEETMETLRRKHLNASQET